MPVPGTVLGASAGDGLLWARAPWRTTRKRSASTKTDRNRVGTNAECFDMLEISGYMTRVPRKNKPMARAIGGRVYPQPAELFKRGQVGGQRLPITEFG